MRPVEPLWGLELALANCVTVTLRCLQQVVYYYVVSPALSHDIVGNVASGAGGGRCPSTAVEAH